MPSEANPPAPPSSPESRSIQVCVLDSIAEVGPTAWNELWSRSDAPSVFARHEWAQAWWAAFGGELEASIYTARENGRLVGLLPTARPRTGPGDVRLIGAGPADYAALLTERGRPDVFAALLDAACADLCGKTNHAGQARLVLGEVRSDSPHARVLEERLAAGGSRWARIEEMPCPRTDIDPERLKVLINKDSLKRHSRKLHKLGDVQVRHETDANVVLPRLEPFFDQHIARWAGTGTESLFQDEANRSFYRHLVEGFSGSGELVFTEISLDGRPVAFHLGFISEGDFLWYKPTFDPELSRISPGEVLLRELFLWSGERGLRGFDFTRGGEAFKLRFAAAERHVATYVCHQSRLAAWVVRRKPALKEAARRMLPGPVVARLKAWREARRTRGSAHGN